MAWHWPQAARPQIMAILNVTPDSFSDGGRWQAPALLPERIEQLLAEGADIIDIGGESTRPGAQAVSEQEELDRVMPAVEIALQQGAVVAVDTSKAVVMRAAIAAGVQIINDVYALRQPGALEAVAMSDVAVCLMHMQGEPRTMQQSPIYGDVVAEVAAFLQSRAQVCIAEGIAPERIALDPGFGFGKSPEHNLRLLNRLDQLLPLGFPLLVGLSRKSLIGQVTGAAVDDRMVSSVALALLACQAGARIVRVHDVQATRQALQLWQAVANESISK